MVAKTGDRHFKSNECGLAKPCRCCNALLAATNNACSPPRNPRCTVLCYFNFSLSLLHCQITHSIRTAAFAHLSLLDSLAALFSKSLVGQNMNYTMEDTQNSAPDTLPTAQAAKLGGARRGPDAMSTTKRSASNLSILMPVLTST